MYNPVHLSVLLLFISLYSINTKEPSIISVPLKVIHNSFEKYPIPEKVEYTFIKETTTKNIFGAKVRKLIQEKVSGTVKKLDCLLFAAPLDIEKDQQFSVILDTGSVNLWVPKIGSKEKYNITNQFGGTLYEYVGKKKAIELTLVPPVTKSSTSANYNLFYQGYKITNPHEL